eukprot:gene15291-16869_t
MEYLWKLLTFGKMKPYKIQDAERKIGRVGVTASSLKDLRKKAARRLNIDGSFRIVLENDGTDVCDEDYFATLPQQTVFVCLKPEEYWDGYITYLQLATKKIVNNISSGKDTVMEVQTIFGNVDSPEMSAVLSYIQEITVNTEAESIEDDPEWFEGVAKTFTTKEKVMKNSAKQRVRGYLSTSKEFINKADLNRSARDVCLQVIQTFREELKRWNYFEDYFARSGHLDVRFCDDSGWFHCGGRYNEKNCEQLHQINPYGSRDHRVLFKTWNLDHRIEKSREVLPKLVKAVQDCPRTKVVNWEYFFALLFTKKNLNIVDIRCHDISAHNDFVVDDNMVYRKKKH